MAIKDLVVEKYVRYFIIPKAQVLDRPGYIYFNITGKTPFFARQVIMPESFFINLEKNITENFDEGKKWLYSAGKKFGFSFAIMGNFSDRKQVSDEELLTFLKIVNNFIEGTYASGIESNVDLKVPKVEYTTKNFVVISKLGYGYFLPQGACAGMLAKIFADKTFETTMTKTDGTISKETGAPYKSLKKMVTNEVFNEENLSNLEVDQNYRVMNQITQTNFAKYSFMDLVRNRVFKYENGFITNSDNRYFIFEISGLYLLEAELSKHPGAKDKMYDAAFESGKNMYIDEKAKLSEIANILSSFGWGDIRIISNGDKLELQAFHFPWTKYYKDTNFIIFRGLVSGVLSKVLNRKVNLEKIKIDLNQGYMTLMLKE